MVYQNKCHSALHFYFLILVLSLSVADVVVIDAEKNNKKKTESHRMETNGHRRSRSQLASSELCVCVV